MSVPVIAIVGRPNVGKSTFFNRLIGSKKAIIDDLPGVTRDRNYSTGSWRDHRFLLIDTGGLDSEIERPIDSGVYEQVHLAIEEADLILFVMDGKDGLMPADQDIHLKLKRSHKPVFHVINKIDNQKMEGLLADFYQLGVDNLFPISAIHGTGIDDLMEDLGRYLTSGGKVKEEAERIRLTIIGRPNVGKSSLLNKILRQERSLVSEEPGTTRDCIDTRLHIITALM